MTPAPLVAPKMAHVTQQRSAAHAAATMMEAAQEDLVSVA